MSRIYQSGSSNNSYKAKPSQTKGYNPKKVSGRSSAIKAEGSRRQRDLKTQEREITRQDTADNMERQAADQVSNLQLKEIQMQQKQALANTQLLDKSATDNKNRDQAANLKAQQQVESFGLANEITAEKSVLSLNQLRARNSLKNEQMLEKESLGREARAQQADFGLDRAYMQAKNSVDNANRQVMQTAIQGLVSLAGTYATQKVAVDEAQKVQDSATNWFNNGGATVLTDEGTVNPVVSQDDLQTETVRATETAVQKVGLDSSMTAVQTDAIREPMQRERMTQSLNQIGVHDAAIAIPSKLNEAWASGTKIELADGTVLDPRTITRGDQVSAWGKAFVGDYVTKSGLINMDPGAVAKSLYPSAINSVSSFSSKTSAEVVTAGINNRKAVALEKAVKALKTGNIPMQEIYSTYSADLYGSGGYNADQPGASKDAATNLLPYMSPEQIRAFGGVEKIKGNKGLTIGELYAPDFEKSLKAERSDIRADRAWHRENDIQTVKTLKQDFNRALMEAETPEEISAAHDAYEGQLKVMASTSDEAMKEFQAQQGISNNYNPFAVDSIIAEAVESGEPITSEYLDDLATTGVIDPAGKKAIIASGIVEMDAPGVTRAKDSVAKMKTEILGAAEGITDGIIVSKVRNMPKGDKVATRQLALINKDLADRAQKALVAEVVENPEIMKEAGVRREFVQNWMRENAPTLLDDVKYDTNTQTLTGYNFAGSRFSDTTTSYPNPVTGKMSRALQGVSTGTLRSMTRENSKGNQVSDLSPVNDRLLSKEELEATVKAISAGKPDQVSARVKAIADIAGITPKALTIYQGMGQDFDVASMYEQPAPPGPGQGGPSGPTNVQEGARAIHAQFGLPKRASAYLSANIQQESGWDGMRDWPGVKNPSTGQMDGTSRNGGLVSWASWSNDPARLGKIEAYLGKDISAATHTEQLQAMMWEMEKDYPTVYAVFTNPLSNDASLQGASEDYWGWGHEGVNRFGSYLTDAKSALNIY